MRSKFQKYAALFTALLAGVVMSMTISQASAYEHDHEHDRHHSHAHHNHAHHHDVNAHRPASSTAAAVEEYLFLHEKTGTREQYRHAHPNGNGCPSSFTCDCGGSDCCDHPGSFAFAITGASRWQGLTFRQQHHIQPFSLLLIATFRAAPAESCHEFRIGPPPSVGWRPILYSDSLRLRI